MRKYLVSAIVGAVGILAFTATSASAAIVCNGEGDCWHVKEKYDYKPEWGCGFGRRPYALPSSIPSLNPCVLRRRLTMFDADECREHAQRFARMATEIDDPVLKQRFAETAAGWLRLAADMAHLDEQTAKLRSEGEKDVA